MPSPGFTSNFVSSTWFFHAVLAPFGVVQRVTLPRVHRITESRCAEVLTRDRLVIEEYPIHSLTPVRRLPSLPTTSSRTRLVRFASHRLAIGSG